MLAAIQYTDFDFPGLKNKQRGKVRDLYFLKDRLIMVATDRISAFDVVLPRAIPYKGQILNQIALHFLEHTTDIVPNWVMASPDPNVTIGKICKPIPVEIVVRAYLAGHAWRQYKAGHRTLCGVALPDGLKENDRLPTPIITPTTKAQSGHDEDISKEEIIQRGIVSAELYEQIEQTALRLFERGTQMAKERNLILVDTKYEFGLYENELHLIDEVHTPDSSRYFYLDTYEELQKEGKPQKQLSKEFVRQWLIENGFQGKEGQEVPPMTDEVVERIMQRYMELYSTMTGKTIHIGASLTTEEVLKRIEHNIKAYLEKERLLA
ncbi:phosphoribosylaminoimidazolesuccinocarboxamide synthase [Thermonema sp.]|uniref:phosphoribosylaminoimidazolesuccinocarboxamide synthase n=1 Tax=Thermonema sp. TaxID=2231181 RepID=UPI00258965E3|nr:phosphoribosylaminoimidazolesuccinocarboxamide synthase [Thermonema sp.]